MSDYVTKDVTAQNQFTDPAIRIANRGTLAIEDTSSMDMTITLQIKPDGAAGWIDSATRAVAGSWLVEGAGEEFRAGCKTGDFTGGTATVHLRSE